MMRGASLPELLIALMLAGIAMAGTLGAMVQAQQSWHESSRLARMHERMQYTFATLEPELQMAGYFGGREDPALSMPPPPALLASCGSSIFVPLTTAVRLLEGPWSLPCAAQGMGAQPGSDVLILHRASTRTTSAADGTLQLLGSPSDSRRRELIVRIFYVARAADGDADSPALRVKSLTAISGKPAFVDTEVMPGIEDMQITLIPDSTNPRFVDVLLRARADAPETYRNRSLQSLTWSRRFTLRNTGS